MGLISRVSSRTYRKRNRKLQNLLLPWLKRQSASTRSTRSATRSSRVTRWTASCASATRAGEARRVSIVPSVADSAVRRASRPSVMVPTRTPSTAAVTTWASRSSWCTGGRAQLPHDVQPHVGLRDRQGRQQQEAKAHRRASGRLERSRHQLQGQAAQRGERVNLLILLT